jgi:sulfur relay (sulfurtransferase) complex TusBCD TusD component (DsrE family)
MASIFLTADGIGIGSKKQMASVFARKMASIFLTADGIGIGSKKQMASVFADSNRSGQKLLILNQLIQIYEATE